MSRAPEEPGGARGLSRLERIAFGWGLRAPVGPVAAPQAKSQPVASAGPASAAGPKRAERTAARRERRDWAYLGMLAFTGILFFRPQDIFPPLEVLHLAELSALVGIGAMINGRMARKERVLPLTREVKGILLFAAIMLALVPFSVWPGGSLAMMTGLYLKVVFIFVLMAATLTTPARLERFSWLILLASGYLGLHAALDYARGIHMVENERLHGAVGGIFDNPNDLALNMVAFLPIAMLIAARRQRPFRRAVAAAVAVLMFATIVFTKSRGGFLGTIAMLAVMLVQGGKVRRGFGVGVLVACLAALPLVPASFWARMASITDDSEDQTGSREARRTVMKEAWAAFLERPLTGVGPGEFKDYNPPWRQERFREAHDVWLQVASETGICGVVVFLGLVFMACRNAWSSTRLLAGLRVKPPPRAGPGAASLRPPAIGPPDAWATVNLYATAMTASIVGWIVCATFASVAYTWTFYYVFGITMATRHMAVRMAAAARPAQGSARSPVAA